MNERQKKVGAFIRFLKKTSKTDNRAVLADLRRGFSKATEKRAWRHIGAYCDLDNERERVIFQTVAACYATNPLNADKESNFGTSARQLKEKFPTIEATFQRLLNCRRPEDVCKRLQSIVLAMKTNGIAVNWKRLMRDLLYWNIRAKERWAAQFWPVNNFADFEETESDVEAEDEGGDE